jgi:predicted aspartyl protease
MGRIYRPLGIWANGKCVHTVGIIDTGADETVISRKIAKKLDLELHGSFEAISASRHRIKGRYTFLSKIIEEWSGKSIKNYPVAVTDDPFDDEEGIEVIIGVDLLQDMGYKLKNKD